MAKWAGKWGKQGEKCVHKFLPINVILKAVDEQDIYLKNEKLP